MTSRRPWLAALALSGLALAAPTSSPLVTAQSPAPRVVAHRADPLPPDQPLRARLRRRSRRARGRRARHRRQHLPRQHGRDRRAVSDPRAVPLSEHLPAARPRPVRRRAARGARPEDPRHRALRSEQDAEGGLRRAPGMVLPARERRAGDLQRALLDLHQRRLLPPARADDPHRGAGTLRGRRPLLQHVRQPGHRLQRRGDGAVRVRRLPRPLPRPHGPRRAGAGRRRVPRVHGRLGARGGGEHRRPDPREAAAGGVPHLHRRSHRRHHVGVEHRGGPAAAAVAVLGQRQRAPRPRLRAGQGGDQPVDGVRGLPVALRARGGARDAAAPLPEHRARRAAGGGRRRHDGAGGSHRDRGGGAGVRVARAARGSLRRPAERGARAAPRHRRHAGVSRVLPPAHRAAHPLRGGDARARRSPRIPAASTS